MTMLLRKPSFFLKSASRKPTLYLDAKSLPIRFIVPAFFHGLRLMTVVNMPMPASRAASAVLWSRMA